jgi:4-hydroxy-tetrahydrodipicolinate reductase
MRIALLGYGKMGKEIERQAIERGWSVDLRIDIDTPPVTNEQRKQIDAVIHFATAKNILADLTPWAELRIPMVVGTTGWNDRLADVKMLVEKNSAALIYASNFSPGVNVFFHLIKTAARAMDRFPEYDVSIHEVHHKNKLDSPSGTALTMAGLVLQQVRRKKHILAETMHGKILPEQLHVSSSRTGAVVGTHTLTFDSLADSIELKHTAKDRSGMASGTLLAAEWIRGKRGVFTMDDVLQELFA